MWRKCKKLGLTSIFHLFLLPSPHCEYPTYSYFGKEENDIQHPFFVAFHAKYWRFARSFDLYGFSRLDFGNALTAQIERSLHTNIYARIKI